MTETELEDQINELILKAQNDGIDVEGIISILEVIRYALEDESD